jgi:hypothetical protein
LVKENCQVGKIIRQNGEDEQMRALKSVFCLALFLIMAVLPAVGQDVVSYKDLKGIQFREYQMNMTIESFDCEATVGKKCQMTVSVVNKGERAEVFNGTMFSIDNAKGTTYRAVPLEGQSAAGLKKELQPGESAQFSVYFDGRIHFDRRVPAHLKYANATKVNIISR